LPVDNKEDEATDDKNLEELFEDDELEEGMIGCIS
jgi:hypothetical protein